MILHLLRCERPVSKLLMIDLASWGEMLVGFWIENTVLWEDYWVACLRDTLRWHKSNFLFRIHLQDAWYLDDWVSSSILSHFRVTTCLYLLRTVFIWKRLWLPPFSCLLDVMLNTQLRRHLFLFFFLLWTIYEILCDWSFFRVLMPRLQLWWVLRWKQAVRRILLFRA